VQVRFPDGTVVRASSLAERRADDPERDFGLYLDPAWAPGWPASLIDWPDFGLPVDAGAAAEAIRGAFERARRGGRVEVGCRGGLGRTGTVLACMAVLAGVPAAEAVAWVRAHYRPAAVETAAQEAWVAWFAQRDSPA
jgi:hypothetical protein